MTIDEKTERLHNTHSIHSCSIVHGGSVLLAMRGLPLARDLPRPIGKDFPTRRQVLRHHLGARAVTSAVEAAA